ncbi:MAG: hypothetical protein A2252_00100 [Elusimicrobia bacterium RIFOXYA2_FULL_39_19]|nr:MAG: hypothetical protein A2252_00100 [Elusimicrobia bacterium RIFOXYA2_FULL_39_19]
MKLNKSAVFAGTVLVSACLNVYAQGGDSGNITEVFQALGSLLLLALVLGVGISALLLSFYLSYWLVEFLFIKVIPDGKDKVWLMNFWEAVVGLVGMLIYLGYNKRGRKKKYW